MNYGAAIMGLLDPLNVTHPISLFVNLLDEPNVRSGQDPKEMFATLSITGLTPGTKYKVYRYNNYTNWPSDSNFP